MRGERTGQGKKMKSGKSASGTTTMTTQQTPWADPTPPAAEQIRPLSGKAASVVRDPENFFDYRSKGNIISCSVEC